MVISLLDNPADVLKQILLNETDLEESDIDLKKVKLICDNKENEGFVWQFRE